MQAGRHLVLALTLGVLACDVAFIEPNPPVLERVSRLIDHPVVDEPVVYAVLLDLHIPDPLECRSATEMVMAAARSFLPPGRTGLELPAQEIAPGCAQPVQRRIDLVALQEGVLLAREQFGDARVRPVFMYVNNVALPLGADLRADLQALRSLGTPTRPAVVFGVGSAAVLEEEFDASVAWTFSADPRLRTAIESNGHSMLPFRSRRPAVELPALGPELLGRAQRMLWCNPGVNLIPGGFGAFATAPVDPLQPPTVRSAEPEVWLEWASQVQSVSIPLELEVCTANCLRYVDDPIYGTITRWSNLTVCLSLEPTE